MKEDTGDRLGFIRPQLSCLPTSNGTLKINKDQVNSLCANFGSEKIGAFRVQLLSGARPARCLRHKRLSGFHDEFPFQQLTGNEGERRAIQIKESRQLRSRKCPLLLEQSQDTSLVDMSDNSRLSHLTVSLHSWGTGVYAQRSL